MFFVFEGLDGAGKTTQLKLFSDWLLENGHDVVTCNDPGSTQVGEQLRRILLGRHEMPIDMRTEMMLFTTARTQLVQQIIRPALQRDQTVVLDRYVLSTVVYQGHAGNLPADEIWQVNNIATAGVEPDLTFVLDLPLEVSMQRLGEARDRMESRGAEYFGRVREGFLHEARQTPDKIVVVDANRPPNAVQQSIRQAAEARCSIARHEN